jgi:hypothetical protein
MGELIGHNPGSSADTLTPAADPITVDQADLYHLPDRGGSVSSHIEHSDGNEATNGPHEFQPE